MAQYPITNVQFPITNGWGGAGSGNPVSRGNAEDAEKVSPGSEPGHGFIDYRTDPFSETALRRFPHAKDAEVAKEERSRAGSGFIGLPLFQAPLWNRSSSDARGLFPVTCLTEQLHVPIGVRTSKGEGNDVIKL